MDLEGLKIGTTDAHQAIFTIWVSFYGNLFIFGAIFFVLFISWVADATLERVC